MLFIKGLCHDLKLKNNNKGFIKAAKYFEKEKKEKSMEAITEACRLFCYLLIEEIAEERKELLKRIRNLDEIFELINSDICNKLKESGLAI